MKCFVDDVSKEKKEELFNLMDNATINILKINHTYLKISKEDYKKNFDEAKSKNQIDDI